MLVLVYFASYLNHGKKYINTYMYIMAEYHQILHAYRIIFGCSLNILLMYRIDMYD